MERVAEIDRSSKARLVDHFMDILQPAYECVDDVPHLIDTARKIGAPLCSRLQRVAQFEGTKASEMAYVASMILLHLAADKSANPADRVLALQTINELEALPTQIVPDLLHVLVDEDPDVRRWVCVIFARVYPPPRIALIWLVAFLAEKHPPLQLAAAKAISEMARTSRDWKTRNELGDPSIEETAKLLRFVFEEEPDVAGSLSETLDSIPACLQLYDAYSGPDFFLDHGAAVSTLCRMYEEPVNSTFKRAALVGLILMGPKAQPALPMITESYGRGEVDRDVFAICARELLGPEYDERLVDWTIHRDEMPKPSDVFVAGLVPSTWTPEAKPERDWIPEVWNDPWLQSKVQSKIRRALKGRPPTIEQGELLDTMQSEFAMRMIEDPRLALKATEIGLIPQRIEKWIWSRLINVLRKEYEPVAGRTKDTSRAGRWAKKVIRQLPTEVDDPAFQDLECRESPTSAGMQRQEEMGLLYAAMDLLPFELRLIVELKLRGYTFPQVGEMLGITTNAASGRFYKALRSLRDALKSHF